MSSHPLSMALFNYFPTSWQPAYFPALEFSRKPLEAVFTRGNHLECYFTVLVMAMRTTFTQGKGVLPDLFNLCFVVSILIIFPPTMLSLTGTSKT